MAEPLPPYSKAPPGQSTVNGGSAPLTFYSTNETTEDSPIEYTPTSHKTGSISTTITSYNNSIHKPYNNSRFPQTFGIYHASGTSSDLVIALRNQDPNPLFHITTHNSWSSKPSVVLHSSGLCTSPQLATAKFTSFSSDVELSILAQSTGRAMTTETMKKDRSQHSCQYFTVEIGGSQTPERFEWKNSQGSEVRSLNGKKHGMKLVRTKTGEVVVAWAPPNSGTRKRGKMAFLSRDALGEKFEVMAVVSILAIMEKGRRGSGGGAAAAIAGAGAAS
ncbi:hypothetical protein BKA65DRAFT_503522 [Rhexocercosporidium sp. MPI-PUGE-AT-0058]|nr:hypothetical protein BKA65DRAFT_503522 [Rhexocercosporidium sp. MPI-PUGE-AT-0058]